MKTIPAIGARVRYIGESSWAQGLTGTVMKIYPAFSPTPPFAELPFDPETWAVSFKVDRIPSYWPYLGSDRFAPAISDIELIEG